MSRKTVRVALIVVAVLALGSAVAFAWKATGPGAGAVVPTASAAANPMPGPAPHPSPSVAPSPRAVPSGEAFDMERYSIDDSASLWVVVNKLRPLDPERYEPADLDTLGALPGGGDQRMVPEAAAALAAMYEQMQADGVSLRVATAYRSHGFQSGVYRDYVATWGRTRAETFSARPGYSEHQTGLAVDVYTTYACRLKACLAATETYVWLADNAAEFGFIERYPAGKQEVTGYRFEPWHWRYVGVELATQMRSTGVTTLEEFFDLPPAPDYLD